MQSEDISKSLQWINYKLNIQITSFDELATGSVLMGLMNVITNQNLNYTKMPKNVFQRIENFSLLFNQIRKKFKHDCTENIMRMVSGDQNELKKMVMTIHRVCTHQAKSTRSILQCLRTKSMMREDDGSELKQSFAQRKTIASWLNQEKNIDEQKEMEEIIEGRVEYKQFSLPIVDMNSVIYFERPVNKKVVEEEKKEEEMKMEIVEETMKENIQQKDDIVEEVKVDKIVEEINIENIVENNHEEKKDDNIGEEKNLEEIKEEIKIENNNEEKKDDIIEEKQIEEPKKDEIEKEKEELPKEEETILVLDTLQNNEIEQESIEINREQTPIVDNETPKSTKEEIPMLQKEASESESEDEQISPKQTTTQQYEENIDDTPPLNESFVPKKLKVRYFPTNYVISTDGEQKIKKEEIKINEELQVNELHPGETPIINEDEISTPKIKIRKSRKNLTKKSSNASPREELSSPKENTFKAFSRIDVDSQITLSEMSNSTESLDDEIIDTMNSLVPNNHFNRESGTTEDDECAGLFRPGLKTKLLGEHKKMKSGLGIGFQNAIQGNIPSSESSKRDSMRKSGVFDANEVKEIIKITDASRTEDPMKYSEVSNDPSIDKNDGEDMVVMKMKKHIRKQSPNKITMKQTMSPRLKQNEYLRMTMAPIGKHFDKRLIQSTQSQRRSRRISVIYSVDQVRKAMIEEKNFSQKEYSPEDIEKIELLQWYIQQHEITKNASKIMKKMKERKGAIMELLNNEKYFIKNIGLLKESLEMLIKHTSIEIFKFAKRYLDKIIEITVKLKQKLEKVIVEDKEIYGNGIAQCFVDEFFAFNEYSHFINLFKPLVNEYNDIIKKYTSKHVLSDYFLQLKLQQQTDFESLCSLPFQHIMRYKIQINRIIDTLSTTDKRYELFEKANHIISDVIVNVNNQYKNFSQSIELIHINEKMDIKLKKTIFGRKIISVQNMDICKIKNKDIYKGKIKNKPKRYCVIIISDAIILLTNKTLIERDVVTIEHLERKTKCDVEAILYLDSIQIMQFDSKTIHISDTSDYLIKFPSTEAKVEFVVGLENVRSQLWSNYISVLKSIKGNKTYSYFSHEIEDISFHADTNSETDGVVHAVLVGIFLFIHKSVKGFVKKQKPLFTFNIFETQIILHMHNDQIITYLTLKQENKTIQLQLQTLDMALFWINIIRIEMQRYLVSNKHFLPFQTRPPKGIHPWYLWQIIPNINGNERCIVCNKYSTLVDLETGKFYCKSCVNKSNKCYLQTSSSALSLLALATTDPEQLLSRVNNIFKIKEKQDKENSDEL